MTNVRKIDLNLLVVLDVLLDEHAYHHVLVGPEAAVDPQPIALTDGAMRLGTVAVHLDMTALALAFGFRSRLEEARDVEPGVESHVATPRASSPAD